MAYVYPDAYSTEKENAVYHRHNEEIKDVLPCATMMTGVSAIVAKRGRMEIVLK